MRYDFQLFLGIDTRQGPIQSSPQTIGAGSIELLSQYAGSSHILQMGQHYQDYVLLRQFPDFQSRFGFPSWVPYHRLVEKERAADVTGNIGEAVAPRAVQVLLGAGVEQIAHLRARRTTSTPDFVLQVTPALAGHVRLPLGRATHVPELWPVEAKAKAHRIGLSVRREALRQLGAYWYRIRYTRPQNVGFGIIVATNYGEHPSVSVHIIIPNPSFNLVGLLRGYSTYANYRSAPVEALGAGLVNYA